MATGRACMFAPICSSLTKLHSNWCGIARQFVMILPNTASVTIAPQRATMIVEN
jgi:hypothetical protein